MDKNKDNKKKKLQIWNGLELRAYTEDTVEQETNGTTLLNYLNGVANHFIVHLHCVADGKEEPNLVQEKNVINYLRIMEYIFRETKKTAAADEVKSLIQFCEAKYKETMDNFGGAER